MFVPILSLIMFQLTTTGSHAADRDVEARWLRSLPKLRLIPYDEFGFDELGRNSGHRTTWQGRLVQCVLLEPRRNCEVNLRTEGAGMAQLLNWHGLGAETIGLTLPPSTVEGVFWINLVRAAAPGVRYEAHHTYDRHGRELVAVVPPRRLPEMDVTPRMLEDIERALALFADLRLHAQAPVFTLTPDGRARLAEHECFGFLETSAEARRMNAPGARRSCRDCAAGSTNSAPGRP